MIDYQQGQRPTHEFNGRGDGGAHAQQIMKNPPLQPRRSDFIDERQCRDHLAAAAVSSQDHFERPRIEKQVSGLSGHQDFHQLSQKALEDASLPSLPIQNLNPNMAVSSAKQGKTRMYLRNPMSLLQRRRSQNVPEAINDRYAGYARSEVPDFDPRIRGKIVHDFNAPRPRTNHSQTDTNRVHSQSDEKATDKKQEGSPERQHTPVFRENFEEAKPWNPREQDPLRHPKSAAMYQLSTQAEPLKVDRSSLPPFARQLPGSFSTTSSPPTASAQPQNGHQLEPVQEVGTSSQQNTILTRPSPPPKARSRASSGADMTFQASSIPKHAKSTSSRFSFDLGGVGSSAQEKLLEEKHREHEKHKEQIGEDTGHDEQDVEADDDDDDILHDDLGVEESIPGVNTDEDAGLEDRPQSLFANNPDYDAGRNPETSHPSGSSKDPGLTISTQTVDSFHFASPERSSFVSPASVASTEYTLPDTPRDDQGNAIGFAYTKSSPNLILPLFQGSQPNTRPVAESNGSLPAQRSMDSPTGRASNPNPELLDASRGDGLEDKDYYCDDDLLDEIAEINEGDTFDESLLDDDSGRYHLPNRYQFEDNPKRDGDVWNVQYTVTSDKDRKQEKSPARSDIRTKNDTANEHISAIQSQGRLAGSHLQAQNSIQHPSLTKDNLEAYHDALALAANQAESNGRFRRSSVQSEQSETVALASPDGLPAISREVSEEDFDYDDALADDSIIAEANAEVLENDDEGFYGQEFGFYARGNSKAEYANGGYFGPQAASIYRSCSGRANFQEPNLTPITERSEFASNRNSAISLVPMFGYPSSGLPLPSPGLAKLAAMANSDEDLTLSYSAYLKSKRMAFGAGGGSNVSLQSSSGNSGSPSSHLPPQGFVGNQSNPNVVNLSPQNMSSSFHSFSSGKGSDSSPASDASPTVTLANNRFPNLPPPPPPPPTNASSNAAVSSPIKTSPTSSSSAHLPTTSSRTSTLMPPPIKPASFSSLSTPITTTDKSQKIFSHSRNSSAGAETYSYTQEPDEHGKRGSGKWIVEKRRLGEDGVEEILGREIVEGGAI